MFKVKIFRGSHVSKKIFYLEFFINEIFSVEKFLNYDGFKMAVLGCRSLVLVIIIINN